MSLSDAINTLKADIAANGFVDGMVEDVAEEWGVNPKLLARKFEEATGRAPADYVIVKVEIDHAARFEAMRARMAEEGWNLHGRMKWDDLTPAEQDRCKQLIERQLTSARPNIAWVR